MSVGSSSSSLSNLLLLLLLSTLLVLLSTAPQVVQGQGLPKSRTQLTQEWEAQQRAQHQAELAREQEEELKRAQAERAKKWRDERRRMREEYLAKQRAKAEAEAERKAALTRKADAARRKQLQQQKVAAEEAAAAARARARAKEEQEREAAKHKGVIAGGVLDCHGIPGGLAVLDACGVCGGDDSSCADCAGVPNGNATEDCAGTCGGSDFSCVDCAGVMNGNSRLDQCGVCNGDGRSCLDCLGVVKGTAKLDVCGVCAGDGTSCLDCRGVPNGPAKLDPCDVCEGDGTTCCSPLITDPISEQAKARDPMPFDTQPPVLCDGHGHCSFEHHCCVCDQGWTGAFCSIRQNLCLQNIPDPDADPDGRKYCNDRGLCDPETGWCRCEDPKAWYGERCQVSRCNYRGSYDLTWGRCHCEHGYGGQYCERCAGSTPRPGVRHVCMEMLDWWQPVPEDLRLERSILLGEENPKAPVFRLEDVYAEHAESYVYGHSFMNMGRRSRSRNGRIKAKQPDEARRDFIWPNSTHAASGYYYDCGCRLAAPPPSAPQSSRAEEKRSAGGNSTQIAGALGSIHRVGRPFRPAFTGFAGLTLSEVDRRFEPQQHIRQNTQHQRMLQARRERELGKRAPVTLSQCQDLLQEVLDEFGFHLDASTAESTELAAAIGDVQDTCGSEASFAFAWFLIAMGVVIAISLFTVICIWGTQRYIRFQPTGL